MGCLGSLVFSLLAILVGWHGFLRPQLEAVVSPFLPTQAAPAREAGQPMTRAELESFVRVRRAVRAAVGDDFLTIAALQSQLQERLQGQENGILQTLQAVGNLAGAIARGKTAQSEALVKEQMSAQRYAQIRKQVERGLGLPSVDLGQIRQIVQQPADGENWKKFVTVPKAEERALVAPFAEELKVTAPLGLVGL